MDYVYKLEDFSVAVRDIAERTDGRIQLEPNRRNVTRDSVVHNYRQFYSDETRKIIAARFERDIDYFKFTF